MSTPVIFFSGTIADVATTAFPENLKEKDVARSKNITPNMLGDLDFVLTGSRKREPTCVRGDDHIAVYQLDHELIEAISSIDEPHIEEVADEWGISDIAGTVELLNQLNVLARRALSCNEEVFVYF